MFIVAGSLDVLGVIRDGFRLWNRNHVLGLPYLLSLAATLAILCFGLAFAVASLSLLGTVGGLLASALILVLAVVGMLVSSAFFGVAAIEMAAKAANGGRPVAADSLRPSREALERLIVINVTTGLAILAVMAPFYAVEFILKVGVIFPLTLMIGCALMFAPYYAVLTKTGWIDCLKSSYRLCMGNKAVVLVMWSFMTYVGVFAAYALMPAAILAASVISLSGLALGSLGGEAYVLIGAFSVFGVFAISYMLFSVLVMGPLVTSWKYLLFRGLGGGA
jgi:hypothetical protein